MIIVPDVETHQVFYWNDWQRWKKNLLNSKTGFSLPVPQFCFRNFVWCFWKALKGKKKGDFVFCKVWMINMFPYHVFHVFVSADTFSARKMRVKSVSRYSGSHKSRHRNSLRTFGSLYSENSSVANYYQEPFISR